MSVNQVIMNETTGAVELKRICGGTLFADAPIGTITPFGGSTIPSGYLLCNGQAVSRTDYSELFAVIGTAFGTGDGSTTFNIPDLRNRAAMGAGTNGTLGESQEDTTAKNGLTSTTSSAGGHSHSVLAYTGDKASISNIYPKSIIASNMEAYSGSYVANADFGGTSRSYIQSAGDHAHPVSISSSDSETRPKNVRVNYIIKAKQSAIPADFMDAVEDAVAEFASVDTVENGNMKAVTSNAVYDALNTSITDLTVDETVMTYDDYTVETLGAHMYQVGMLCWVHIDMRVTYTGEVALDTDGHKDFWSNKFSIPDFDDVSEWNAIPCFGYVSNSHRTFEITLNNFGAPGGQKAIAFRLRHSEDEPIYTGDAFNLRCVCCFAKV